MNRPTAILLSFGVGLLCAGLSIFLQVNSQTIHVASKADLIPISSPVVEMGIGSSFEVPGKPFRLLIPAIGVDAVIQSVGLSEKITGEMAVPTNYTDVGWYNKGPVPGMPGNAVIDGHLNGKKFVKAVFYDLDKLMPGDSIYVIDENDKTLEFIVTGKQLYDYNANTTDIFAGDTKNPRLNLITCAGDWMNTKKLYDKRMVISAIISSRR